MQTILVTGAAGFIGYHVAQRLLTLGHRVIGLDNLNEYYGKQLKLDRIALLTPDSNFQFELLDLTDRGRVADLFRKMRFDRVIHLAAQAGVRYSVENPYAYIDANIAGTITVLEGCRNSHVPHLVFASSSSVYGLNTQQPYSPSDPTNHPISLYAASKKANEMMAHCYSHLYGIPITGLRFFTVYGPWGRPDMALFKFTKSIMEGTPIELYNNGNMRRDFTYVDDVVDAVVRVSDHVPIANPKWDSKHPDPASSSAPFKLFNVGNKNPTQLSEFIEVIERVVGKKAVCKQLEMQAGDVQDTYADIGSLEEAIGFSPKTKLEDGIAQFVDWYRRYNGM